MSRCFCWNVARDGHDAACAVRREEARERQREQATAARLLDDLGRVYGDRLVDLEGWAPGEVTEAFGS